MIAELKSSEYSHDFGFSFLGIKIQEIEFFSLNIFHSEKYIENLHSFGVLWKLIHVHGKKIQIKIYEILTNKI